MLRIGKKMVAWNVDDLTVTPSNGHKMSLRPRQKRKFDFKTGRFDPLEAPVDVPNPKRVRTQTPVEKPWFAKGKQPQKQAFEYARANPGRVLIKRGQYKFGLAALEWLDDNWRKDNHLLELAVHALGGGIVKPFFDFDRYPESREAASGYMDECLIAAAVFLKQFGHDWAFDSSRDGLCVSLAEKSNGILKWSAHLVINDGSGWNISDIDSVRAMAYALNKAHPDCVDPDVYTVHRAMKLPHQTKEGDNPDRAQIPTNKTLGLDAFLIGHGSAVSNLTPLIVPETVVATSEWSRKKGGSTTKRAVVSGASLLEMTNGVECIPPLGQPSDSLQYLCESIPVVLKDGSKPSHTHWLALGGAIKTVDSGAFDLFFAWMRRRGTSHSRQALLAKWSNDFDVSKSGGREMLTAIASQCNPRLRERLSRPGRALPPRDIDRHIAVPRHALVQGKFLPQDTLLNALRDHDVVTCKMPMGCGKSYSAKHAFGHFDNSWRIFCLSTRQKYAAWLAADLQELGFDCYLNMTVAEIQQSRRLVISLESLTKALPAHREKPAGEKWLLVMDESESLAKLLGSQTVWQNSELKIDPRETILAFRNAIQRCDKVLCMDAYLDMGPGTTALLRDIAPHRPVCHISVDSPPSDIVYKAVNVYEKDPSMRHLNDQTEALMFQEMAADLKAGRRVYFATATRGSQIRCLAFLIKAGALEGELVGFPGKEKFVGEPEVGVYNGTDKLGSENVETQWGAMRFVTNTPTITCGVSHSMSVFDKKYLYFSDYDAACVRDVMQASCRVRHVRSNTVRVCFQIRELNKKKTVTQAGVLDEFRRGLKTLKHAKSLLTAYNGEDISFAHRAIARAHAEDNRTRTKGNAVSGVVSEVGRFVKSDGGRLIISKHMLKDSIVAPLVPKADKDCSEPLPNFDETLNLAPEEYYRTKQRQNKTLEQEGALKKYEYIHRYGMTCAETYDRYFGKGFRAHFYRAAMFSRAWQTSNQGRIATFEFADAFYSLLRDTDKLVETRLTLQAKDEVCKIYETVRDTGLFGDKASKGALRKVLLVDGNDKAVSKTLCFFGFDYYMECISRKSTCGRKTDAFLAEVRKQFPEMSYQEQRKYAKEHRPKVPRAKRPRQRQYTLDADHLRAWNTVMRKLNYQKI